MTLFQHLINLDKSIFHKINGQWIHPILDATMPFITDINKTKYYIVGLVVVIFLLCRLKTFGILIGCALAVAVADSTAARIIKPAVDRTRPAYSAAPVRLLITDQASESFPSNHAANIFAAAKFLTYYVPDLSLFFALIALLVSYSRIYVGVHYPLDVLGGALLGYFSAVMVHYVISEMGDWVRRKRRLPPPPGGLWKRRLADKQKQRTKWWRHRW